MDLETGTIAQLRNEKLMVAVNGVLAFERTRIPLSSYSSNGKNSLNREYDIVKLFRPKDDRLKYIFNSLVMIWEEEH